jgi:hypothetical protein
MTSPHRAWIAFLALWAAMALPPSGQCRDTSGHERERIDLLKLIDLKKDSVAGTWTFEEGTLVTTGKPFERIQIPYIPPEEYDVVVVSDRKGGSNSLNLGLALGEVQFMVILDAQINGELASGLDLVDGVEFYRNVTCTKDNPFIGDKPNLVVCSVRKTRISVKVNGKRIIDWKADTHRLSLFAQWKVPEKNTLFLGTWTGVVRYHKLELIPVSGRGRGLR